MSPSPHTTIADSGPAHSALPERLRSRGCVTCRVRKVKCNRERPVCATCKRLGRKCEWADGQAPPPRKPRRPFATACSQCRARKIKCEGQGRACERCLLFSLPCDWVGSAGSSTRSGGRLSPPRWQPTGGGPETPSSTSLHTASSTSSASPCRLLGQDLSTASSDTAALIDLYFNTVHNFGFFTFIHEFRFKRLLHAGKAPRDLTAIMVANALRFAAEPTQNNLERSDNIVNGIVAKLVPRVLEGFGVVHLMLMSLQTVDEHAAAVSDLSPLLTHEALRRVAWSVFFLDSTLDGGRLGSGLVDVSLFHIQLPCTEESFMGNDNPRTGSIFESPSEDEGATLGISAHLMRAVLLRRRAFDILLRLRHRNFDALRTESDLVALELSLTEVTTSLPPRYRFSEDTAYLYRQRMPAFLLFHLLLLKVSIVINTTRLALLQKSGATASADIAPLRLERIKHAISISRIVAEGLKHPAPWDMQASAHAYIALESTCDNVIKLTAVLLFEPRRLTELHDTEQVLSKDVSTSIAPLLVALREGSARSEIVRLLHIEAVHRLLRCDLLCLLNGADLEAFSTEYQPGQDEAEFDFSDFRFARIERLRSTRRPTSGFRSERMLEYQSCAPSRATSPGPSSSVLSSSAGFGETPLLTSHQEHGPLGEIGLGDGSSEFTDAANFSWLLGDVDTLQTGDPDVFWRQIMS